MASIYDVDQNALIEKAALELKKIPEMKAPAWAMFCKTGTFKERPPMRGDWWFVRSASILRKVARMGPIGVAKLRTLYGGKKNMGMRPERFYKGSGSILRKALQGLEKAGLVKQDEKSKYKGRRITPKGKSLLDKAATAVQKEEPKVEVKKAKPKSPAAGEKKPEAKAVKAEEKKAEPEAKEKVVEGKTEKKPQQKEEPQEKPKVEPQK